MWSRTDLTGLCADSRIDADDEREIGGLARRFSVSPEQVRMAVAAVGNSAVEVENHLKDLGKIYDPREGAWRHRPLFGRGGLLLRGTPLGA